MTAAPPPTDLKDTLETMRASVAARSTRKGLNGTIEGAFLKIFELLLTLLMDFRAGKLAPPVTDAVRGADGEVAHPPTRLVRPIPRKGGGRIGGRRPGRPRGA